MIKCVFYVCSPLQLICAYSFITERKYQNYLIISFVLDFSSRTTSQIKKVAEYYCISKKNLRFITITKHQKVNLIKIILVSAFFRLYHVGDNIIFVFADFYNTHFHFSRIFFNPDSTYLLDDGFSSFRAISTDIIHKKFIPTSSWIDKNLVLSRLFSERHFITYSIYSRYFPASPYLKRCNILPSIRQRRVLSIHPLTCIFIGTKLSERSAISLQNELTIMKNINNHYSLNSIHCIYYAKRSSSTYKLELLAHLGFQVLTLDTPLEIYLQELSLLPGTICGFGSTLFATVHSLFPLIKCDFLDISDYLKYESDIHNCVKFREYYNKTKYLNELIF